MHFLFFGLFSKIYIFERLLLSNSVGVMLVDLFCSWIWKSLPPSCFLASSFDFQPFQDFGPFFYTPSPCDIADKCFTMYIQDAFKPQMWKEIFDESICFSKINCKWDWSCYKIKKSLKEFALLWLVSEK